MPRKKAKPIYLLSPKLPFKTFKKLYDASGDSGPAPMHGAKMLYEMMKTKKVFIWFEKGDKDLRISLKLPDKRMVYFISPKYPIKK
jgi:hypothetical protein